MQETDIERVEIPSLQTKVARIGIGTWAAGGWMWGGTDEDEAVAAIEAGLYRGLDLIDTAPAYGFGRSEEIVGRALDAWDGDREDVVIATKVGLNWEGEGIHRDSTPERIRTEIEDSLRRLGTEYVDIYQVHWPDHDTPIEKTAEALRNLWEQKTIRAIGVSNYSVEEMELFRKEAPLHIVQPPLNVFERESAGEILPYAREHGIVSLTYGALCRGLLSGRITEETEFHGDDLRKVDPKFRSPRFEQYLKAVSLLDAYARQRYDRRVVHMAVRWVLDSGADVALWGFRRPDQTEPIAEVFGWSLDKSAFTTIDSLISEVVGEDVGPEFMAP